MITQVTIENFKRFEHQKFLLEPVTVLAGQNNSGKTTLIQALSSWAFALDRWRFGRGAPIIRGDARASYRPGQPITRKDFTPLPLSHFNLLWNERTTSWRNKDRHGGSERKAGRPRPIHIRVEGQSDKNVSWGLTIEFRYQGPEQIYANPLDYNDLEDDSVLPGVMHCPAFSGIGAEEPRFDPGYRNLRIGEGKPGDVLRNLLLDIAENEDAWNALTEDIEKLFEIQLKKPAYDSAQPFILCEYKERGASYDLASAGSGFHQTLLLFAFIYGRESEVLLVDEPDAHLHVWLQTRVFDRLRALAMDRGRQLILATHAETILEAANPNQILSFAGSPHILAHQQDRKALRTVIRNVSPLDLLLAEQGRAVLYCEDMSDWRILEAWAKRLNHPAEKFFENPFVHTLQGHRPSDARHHLFGLRAIDEDVRGLLLLDRDNRDVDEHDFRAENLDFHRWKRYEIENYLLVPSAIERLLGSNDLFNQPLVREAFNAELPSSVITDPLRDIEAVVRIPASKTILPNIFGHPNAMRLFKADYYRIAEVMEPEEIHHEVTEVLDKIATLPASSRPVFDQRG